MPVSSIEFGQVTIDARFDFLHPPLQLGTGEVSVTIIDGFELAAVDGNQGFREQSQLLTQHHKLTANIADRFAVVFAETGDGLEVRHQTPRQPHQLDIALALFLKAPAGLDAIEVAVDVKLQKYGGVIGRPTGGCRLNTLESQLAQSQFIDEDIHDPYQIGLRYVVVKAFREQRALGSASTFDETLHGGHSINMTNALYHGAF